MSLRKQIGFGDRGARQAHIAIQSVPLLKKKKKKVFTVNCQTLACQYIELQ